MIDSHAKNHSTGQIFAKRGFLPKKSSALPAYELDLNYIPQLGMLLLQNNGGMSAQLRFKKPPAQDGVFEYLATENMVGLIYPIGKDSRIMTIDIATGEQLNWAITGVPRFCTLNGKKLFAYVEDSLVTRELGGGEVIANRGDLARLEAEYGEIVRFLPDSNNGVLIFMERAGRTVAVKVDASDSDATELLLDTATLFPSADFVSVATFNQCAHRNLVFFGVNWQYAEGNADYASLALNVASGELLYVAGAMPAGDFAPGDVVSY